MALQCQSFRDKFYHIPNLFKFYYELNETDKKIAREKKITNEQKERKKNHGIKKRKKKPTNRTSADSLDNDSDL